MLHAPQRTGKLAIPLVTLAMLIAILAFGGVGQQPIRGAQEYFDRVARSIDSVPYQLGGWVGVDLPFTDVEVRMLRPNKLFSRTYQDPHTGHRASLSIVHCTDVRDMKGHYPPVCYPAHGWELKSAEPIEVVLDDSFQQAMLYSFDRSNSGTREVIRIVSFFAVPQGTGILCEMKGLDSATKRPEVAGLGAAQVQILTPGSQSAEPTAEMVSKILKAVEPVVDMIEEGVR